MTHLVVTYEAIRLLASQRRWQSTDFEDCTKLVNFIIGRENSFSIDDLYFHSENKGLFILTDKCDYRRSIIFDFSTFNEFTTKNDINRIITIFQKTIKLAIKIFEDINLSKSERQFTEQGKNLAIVCPFSVHYGQINNTYEVALDRTPDFKRTSKRDQNHLLVFSAGVQARNQPFSYTVFRKAINELKNTCLEYKSFEKPKSEVKSLKVESLGEAIQTKVSPSLGVERLKYHLTKNQVDFINKNIDGPQRLEGAAGTGKTLTLILKAINVLSETKRNNKSINILFINHSTSTKKSTFEIFQSNLPGLDTLLNRSHSKASIEITTLQEWCIQYLGTGISNTEYLDLNAEDSKQYQLMFIEESLSDALDYDFESYKNVCSPLFINFFETTKREDILEMLQSEIGVTIKGRAGEDFDKYKALPRLKYSIPVKNEADLGFLHNIYNYYQQRLNTIGQFDSDDISISSLKQLDTPIWRRRRKTEGYDIVFIDETHLFNLNELSVFHHLTKDINKNLIVFAVDKSQAIGDKWLEHEGIFDFIGKEDIKSENKLALNTVFRSSPEIINLAFEILSSGTTLFTTFENPLEKTFSSFTSKEEKLSFIPKYVLLTSDEEIIKHSFIEAENICKEYQIKRSEILIIGTSLFFTNRLKQYAEKKNKPVEVIKSRGDSEIVNKAYKDNKYIISGIDYIGGLEFSYVIISGVDKGRVPPVSSEDNAESFNFLNYAWHNRLYVAVSRAKYSVIIIGNKGRGASNILTKAIEKGSIVIE